MNEKVNKVLVGFARLTEAEKSDFLKTMKEFQDAGPLTRQTLSEGMLNKSVGPKDSYCTCCGR